MSVQKHKLPANTFLKRSVYYYQRRVPNDLRKHYKTNKVTLSLKTKDAKSAGKASRKISHEFEQYWLDLRLKDYDKLPIAQSFYAVSNQLLMSEAKQQYLDVKGIGRTEKFESTCNRCIGYLFDVVSDKPLDEYKASDAIAFRDSLARRGLSPVTIKKVFATVKAVHNFATKENGLDITNPFTGVHIETSHYKVVKRQPIHNNDIKLVQVECFAIKDELRLLIALISDSGMRLAEAAGLMISDIVLDDEVPHAVVKPHKHRRLKTKSSEGLIPLVGSSFQAAQIITNNSTSDYCFPRYSNTSNCNAASASASINKWLKNVTNKNVLCHGFRHSLRDRLRAADIGIEPIDEIGGWSRQSVGARYGNGYSLEKKQEALIKMLGEGGQ